MNRPTRLRTLAVFLGIVLAVVAFSVVRAHDFGSCPNPATPGNSARFWENSIGDTSSGNDTWYGICHRTAPTGYGDLRTVSVLPYACHNSSLDDSYTWNDCISSVTVWLASPLWRLCLYRDLHQSGLVYWIMGPENGSRWDLPSDTITSVWLTNTGVCP